MRTFKKLLGATIAFNLSINLFVFQPVRADDIYSPDNSNKPDPLQVTKQLRGNFHVGEFSGSAIYNYPIVLPTGRNGLTPNVQLTYNNQDSSLDTVAGYRWNLNSYSIKRINKKGVEKLYNEKDFVANTPAGNGELSPVQLTNGQFGRYGQKVERGFSKYEFKNDNTWIVTDKQGTQYKFGLTDEGRQFDPDSPSRTYQWMLEEVRDLNDNFIRYTYIKDGNQVYPKTIHYTGHGTEDGVFEVVFESGLERKDIHTSYAAGFQVQTKLLITKIDVYANGQLRRKYDIGHTTVDPLIRKTIGQITETGYNSSGQATSLPPTTFEYTPSAVSWQATNNYMPNWIFESCYYECQGAKWTAQWDMTGDGLVDFEHYGNLDASTVH